MKGKKGVGEGREWGKFYQLAQDVTASCAGRGSMSFAKAEYLNASWGEGAAAMSKMLNEYKKRVHLKAKM